jgi:hypothetical protein
MTTPAVQLNSLNHTTTKVVWDTSIVGPVTDDWWDVQVVVTGGTVTLAVFLGIQ